ncbi:MAG: hypothetical protein R2690_09440 [Acidimicrobiales bacterium]
MDGRSARRAIELVTMCAAVAQPVYAVLGANTAEPVARQVDGVAIVATLWSCWSCRPGCCGSSKRRSGAPPQGRRGAASWSLGLLAAVVAIQLAGDRPSAPAVAVLAPPARWGWRSPGPTDAGARSGCGCDTCRSVPWSSWLRSSSCRRCAASSSRSIEPVAASAADRPDVVVLVLDELLLARARDDGWGHRRRSGTWLRLLPRRPGTATPRRRPRTVLAVPSLLSGTYPTYELGPMAADYPNTVFTLLGGSHDLNVGVGHTAVP